MVSFKKLLKKSAKVTFDPLGSVRDVLGGSGGESREGKVDALYGQARNQAGLNYSQSIATQRRSLGTTRKAYGAARGALGAGRTQAIQGVQDAGAQAGANSMQSLTDRGLGSTTILQNAQQGISSGVSRATAGIEADYARMMAELGIGEAGATSGIRRGIAGSYEGLAATQAGLYSQHAGTIASLPAENPDAWLDSLLGIGGTVLGYGLTGGFGGGGGAPSALPPTNVPPWYQSNGYGIPQGL